MAKSVIKSNSPRIKGQCHITTTKHYPTRLKFKFLQTLELHCQEFSIYADLEFFPTFHGIDY